MGLEGFVTWVVLLSGWLRASLDLKWRWSCGSYLIQHYVWSNIMFDPILYSCLLCRQISISIGVEDSSNYVLCKLGSVWETSFAKYPPKIQRLKFVCTQATRTRGTFIYLGKILLWLCQLIYSLLHCYSQ